MTLTQDRHFQTGIAGSLVIHALALLLIAGIITSGAGKGLLKPAAAKPKEREREKVVTMIFPDQIMVPPVPKPKPLPVPPPPVAQKVFIRTSQNEAAAAAPKGAAFESDRNTTAASEKMGRADAMLAMPTMAGNAPTQLELANRDFQDGAIKDDAAAPKEKQVAAPPPPPPPQMRSAPPVPPPAPSPTPAAQVVAKATPEAAPLAKMMEEMDKEAAKMDPNRLPLDVRTPEAKKEEPKPEPEAEAPKPQMRTPDMVAVKPQVREPQDDLPPPVPKAIPVAALDPLRMPAKKGDKDTFSPFTRQSKVDGNVTRQGQNAVDAEATPRGKYMRQVTGAVEKRWHNYVRLKGDAVTFGRVRFGFYVDRRGVPQDLTILSDARDADPRMRELTLRAILDAEIPPIPDDLLPQLDGGRMKIEYEAIIYQSD